MDEWWSNGGKTPWLNQDVVDNCGQHWRDDVGSPMVLLELVNHFGHYDGQYIDGACQCLTKCLMVHIAE